jgi:hypothetical protein
MQQQRGGQGNAEAFFLRADDDLHVKPECR